MRPSVLLEHHRDEVRAIALAHRVTNPRVFGSVLRGEDTDSSDLDLLVDALPGATLLDLARIALEVEERLGVEVDVLTPEDLPPKYRAQVVAEAQPV
jgi:predicted nucleotidyltransferase